MQNKMLRWECVGEHIDRKLKARSPQVGTGVRAAHSVRFGMWCFRRRTAPDAEVVVVPCDAKSHELVDGSGGNRTEFWGRGVKWIAGLDVGHS